MNETIFDYSVTDREKMIIHVKDWKEVEYVKNTGKREKLQHLYLPCLPCRQTGRQAGVLFMIRCESDKAKTILKLMLKKAEVFPVM